MFAVLLALGCARTEADSVIDYFWPLKEGQIFVYELEGGGKRIIEIMKIQMKAEGDVIMETDQHVEGVNFVQEKLAMREIFRVVPKQSVIYRASLSAKEPPREVLYLRGPVQQGVEWSFEWISGGRWIVSEPRGEPKRETKATKGSGVCRIDGIKMESVVGQEARCAVVECPIQEKEARIINRLYHCKGIGYIGTEVEWAHEGRETEAKWIEKLVQVTRRR